MNQLLTSLQTVFAPMDVEVLAATQGWALARRAALKEFKASTEYQALRGNTWALYDKLFALCGGKTWYGALNGSNHEEFVAKNCATVAAKRDAAIAKKLTKAGVTNVVSEQYTSTKDGFDGYFVVNTNTGTKRVKVQTIRAGGYNIQCLHLRVLVSIK